MDSILEAEEIMDPYDNLRESEVSELLLRRKLYDIKKNMSKPSAASSII
jgi:hypothetical protein